jgi:hypothetical protein
MHGDKSMFVRILVLLDLYHIKHPELRFGQIVVNLFGEDPFYKEDKELYKILKDKLEEENV